MIFSIFLAGQKLAEPSRLQVLSLASCGLTDSVLTSLTDAVSVGQLASLLELNLTKNTALTSKGLPTILGLTSGLCLSESTFSDTICITRRFCFPNFHVHVIISPDK